MQPKRSFYSCNRRGKECYTGAVESSWGNRITKAEAKGEGNEKETICRITGCSGKSGESSAGTEPAQGRETQQEVQGQGDESEKTEEAKNAQYTLKIAVGIPQSHKDIGNIMKEVIEKETNGAVKVNVFADNALGSDREVLEAVQLGDIDITLSNMAPLAAAYSDLYLFDTMFLINTREQAYEILDGEIGQHIAEGLKAKNLKTLSFPENGFRNLTTNDREVHTPADMKGLKVRVMENEIQIAYWKALGANPTPMAFGEVFTALQQKTIDGQENPVELIYDNKLNEVQKYMIMTQHIYNPLILAMNNETFNGMPAEYQDAVMKAAREATDYERGSAQEYEQDRIKKIEEDKTTEIIYLTDEERNQFKEAVKEVNSLVKEKMDHPELFDMAMEAVGQ